jgi:hypothetical protein
MAPLAMIVKVGCGNQYDLTTSRVLGNFTDVGGPCAGWTKGVFEAMHPNKAGEMKLFKRPYLLNTATLDMVTVQLKAWNDSFAYRMRIALQLKAYKERHQTSPEDAFLMVVDNVGSHKTAEVLEEFQVCYVCCTLKLLFLNCFVFRELVG